MTDSIFYVAQISATGPVYLLIHVGYHRYAFWSIDLITPPPPGGKSIKAVLFPSADINSPQPFKIANTGEELRGKIIHLDPIISSQPAKSAPGGPYSFDVDVLQQPNGQPVPVNPGPIRERGLLNDESIAVEAITISFNVN